MMLLFLVPKVAVPTAAEREERELTHFPYRSWCADCVRGRGIASHHQAQTWQLKVVPSTDSVGGTGCPETNNHYGL